MTTSFRRRVALSSWDQKKLFIYFGVAQGLQVVRAPSIIQSWDPFFRKLVGTTLVSGDWNSALDTLDHVFETRIIPSWLATMGNIHLVWPLWNIGMHLFKMLVPFDVHRVWWVHVSPFKIKVAKGFLGSRADPSTHPPCGQKGFFRISNQINYKYIIVHGKVQCRIVSVILR